MNCSSSLLLMHVNHEKEQYSTVCMADFSENFLNIYIYIFELPNFKSPSLLYLYPMKCMGVFPSKIVIFIFVTQFQFICLVLKFEECWINVYRLLIGREEKIFVLNKRPRKIIKKRKWGLNVSFFATLLSGSQSPKE